MLINMDAENINKKIHSSLITYPTKREEELEACYISIREKIKENLTLLWHVADISRKELCNCDYASILKTLNSGSLPSRIRRILRNIGIILGENQVEKVTINEWKIVTSMKKEYTLRKEEDNFSFYTHTPPAESPEEELWPPLAKSLIQRITSQYEPIDFFNRIPPLGACISLSLLSMRNLLITESTAVFTRLWDQPKQPHRDHVCHILLAYHIMSSLIPLKGLESAKDSSEYKLQDGLLKRVTKQLSESPLFKEFISTWRLSQQGLFESVQKAAVIMALCHDLAYPLEIANRVRNHKALSALMKNSKLKDRKFFESDKEIYQKVVKRLLGRIAEDENLVECSSFKTLEKWFNGGIENNGDGPDHGQLSAIFLLLMFVDDDWDTLKPVDKFTLILACVGIFNHANFTKSEVQNPLLSRKLNSSQMWQYDPLGVVLALVDLLSEGPRTHWGITSISENSCAWKQEVQLTHALCIPQGRIIIANNNIQVEYDYYLKKFPDPFVWPIKQNTDLRFDLEKAIGGGKKKEICEQLTKTIFDESFTISIKPGKDLNPNT